MTVPAPHIRASGAGPSVICLHANASSSAQWRGLMDLLSADHRVFAPDLYGAGRSPDWPSDSRIALRDEVDFLAPVFEESGEFCVLVGHSYGAAVALVAALAMPERVRALAIYEPTLFAVVDAFQPRPNGTEGIHAAVAASVAALDGGDPYEAARHFIDYWMSDGSFAAMPEPRRQAVAESMRNVRRWAHALTTEPTPLEAFAALDMPVLYMLGASSPESVHAVANVLTPRLPRVEVVEFAGLRHMAPVTHAEVVNAEIVRFIADVAR
jgi:pimeloyl-ACP methyl ester carboxylesterase